MHQFAFTDREQCFSKLLWVSQTLKILALAIHAREQPPTADLKQEYTLEHK